MTYKDFIQQLQEQTSTLSYQKSLAMAILLCRKLLPDYQAFSATHGWGDPRVLEEAIQCCESAQARIVMKEEIDPLFERLYAVTPDTEDFGDYDGSYGLNAAAALLHALQYVKGKDSKDIYAIGTLYTDTIDVKLHEMKIDDEDEIENYPLMQEAWQLVVQLSYEH
jgi:uncharacterized protein YjaG (DUF416 family)